MQLSIRLCLLLIISIGAALSTLTHANNTFWEDQSNQDSFLGLPANAEISDLNLKIIKQSAKYNEPHHLANYLYDISNLFNNFYQTEKVHSIKDKEIKYSKLLITEYFLKHSNLIMNCLGIKPVDRM